MPSQSYSATTIHSLEVTVTTLGPEHVVHSQAEVVALLCERLPNAVAAVIHGAAPEVQVGVRAVERF